MSVFVRLEEKKFGSDNARGKWYAKMVRMGEVGVDELAERIQAVSTFKHGEVRGILIELLEQMKYCLQDGQTVNLEGFGRFHLAVESEPAVHPEKFRTDKNVKRVKCKFLPTGYRRKDGRIVQRLADGVKVERWTDENEKTSKI